MPSQKRNRKTYHEKLRPDMKPEVVSDPRTGGKLLLPTPMLLASEIRKVKRGCLITAPELRQRLATIHAADATCPLMTGIFLNIIAGAQAEAEADGKQDVAPWWRVVPADGRLSTKTPPGPEQQAERLRKEGHSISSIRGGLRVALPHSAQGDFRNRG